MDDIPLVLPVAKIDKHGRHFWSWDVIYACIQSILADDYFDRWARQMTSDMERATERTDRVTRDFLGALDNFKEVQQQFVEQSKRAAGNVRDASEKLAQGLARIEKAANFERLERYVVLLERGAAAMKTLAELEAGGKLEKIAAAMR